MGLRKSILYLALHNQLIKKAGNKGFLTKQEFNEKLGKHFMVPKGLRVLVLKEMEDNDFVFVESDRKIIIKETRISIKENTTELFKNAGLL